MGLAATNEEQLSELFEAAIIGMAPRLTYKGAQDWRPHDRETPTPTTTRRFRQVWEAGDVQPGGTMAGRIIEHYATLRVRTEYAGDHSKQQFIVIDDHHQLRDTLSALKSTDANGLVLVASDGPPQLVSEASDDSPDVATYDHVFTVRFMRNIAP